jgi:hypothetical protein
MFFFLYIYMCLLQQRNLIYQFGLSLPKDPVFVTIPVKDKIKKNRVRYLRCPVILPHEVVHHMAFTGQFHVDSQDWDWEVMMPSTAWLAAKLSLSA